VAKDRESLRTAKREFSAVAILLLEHGADSNDGAGDFLPLQTAALVGDKALAEAAIAHGAALNRLSRDGTESPLHASLAEGHGDVAELLIDRGADVNAPNMSGLTPLHFVAVYLHDRGLAELLIRHGANVNATDQSGHTPLEGAVRDRRPDDAKHESGEGREEASGTAFTTTTRVALYQQNTRLYGIEP
jgi:ankyrin repeat protein